MNIQAKYSYSNWPDRETRLNVAVYGYGTVSIFVITIISFCGLLVVKFRHKAAYNHVIHVMLGLGIGTLVGDAFLHLIPHVCVTITSLRSVLACSNCTRCYDSERVVALRVSMYSSVRPVTISVPVAMASPSLLYPRSSCAKTS